MGEDRIKGSAKNIGGKAKEGLEKATGDKKTETEGKTEPAQPVIRLIAPEPVSARVVIHLIEDNAAVREAARDLFEGAGWDVCDHFSAEEFLAGPRPNDEACMLIDVTLPGINGVALLELLRKENVQVPAIMLTGRNDATTAVAALKAGAEDYIEKPAD